MCQLVYLCRCFGNFLLNTDRLENALSWVWQYLSCKPCRETTEAAPAEPPANINNAKTFDSEMELATYHISDPEHSPPEDFAVMQQRSIIVHFKVPHIVETKVNGDTNSLDGSLSDDVFE
ncbi:PREDICTED: uncharacterized protein LOC106113715 [Papilio xuthus]|uniref:Uncharacterized protein LOC106113715 n=1 Tax=Papilio xuthus TaxID=66420 RepID=A0AAJ6YZF5_PAPXU|nr:PREDICTED: uncharacterized protein LOC106113715 [Papilio xuthus]